jgi:hypothetical protein
MGASRVAVWCGAGGLTVVRPVRLAFRVPSPDTPSPRTNQAAGDAHTSLERIRPSGLPCIFGIPPVAPREVADDGHVGAVAPGGLPTSMKMEHTVSSSLEEETENPTSMTSTPRRASWRAWMSFSVLVIVALGNYFPSHNVVSKKRMSDHRRGGYCCSRMHWSSAQRLTTLGDGLPAARTEMEGMASDGRWVWKVWRWWSSRV